MQIAEIGGKLHPIAENCSKLQKIAENFYNLLKISALEHSKHRLLSFIYHYELPM